MLVLSFLPFSSQRFLHMKAKSKWAGLPFLSPGLLTSCLTLAFRPATVIKCGMGGGRATQLNPSALRAAIPERKTEVQPGCRYKGWGSAYISAEAACHPPKWMNKWWPHSQLCGAKQMETLTVSSGKGTIRTPSPKGRNSISFESVVCCQITRWSMSLSPP